MSLFRTTCQNHFLFSPYDDTNGLNVYVETSHFEYEQDLFDRKTGSYLTRGVSILVNKDTSRFTSL